MVSGRRLFDGADEGEIYGQVLRADVPKPSKIACGDRAKVTDAIVLRGLTRSPEKRYLTARAAALAIEGALPLPPPSQGGQWVERVGGPELAERARRIAEVEGTAGQGTSAPRLPRPRDTAAMATAPGSRMAIEELSLVATRPITRPVGLEVAHTDTSLVSSELEPAAPRSRRAYVAGIVGAV